MLGVENHLLGDWSQPEEGYIGRLQLFPGVPYDDAEIVAEMNFVVKRANHRKETEEIVSQVWRLSGVVAWSSEIAKWWNSAKGLLRGAMRVSAK